MKAYNAKKLICMEPQAVKNLEGMSGFLPLFPFFVIVAGSVYFLLKWRKEDRDDTRKMSGYLLRLDFLLFSYIALLYLNYILLRLFPSRSDLQHLADLQLLYIIPLFYPVFHMQVKGFWHLSLGAIAISVAICALFWVGVGLGVLKPLLFMLALSSLFWIYPDKVRGDSSHLYVLLLFLILLLADATILMCVGVLLKLILAILLLVVIFALSMLWLIKSDCIISSLKVYGTVSSYRQDVRVLAEDNMEYGNYEIKSRIFALFEKEKPYLSPDLTIADLAKMLYTNQSYLSKFLNNGIKMNFNEFVNNYRVNEAISLFEENNNLTLTDLCRMSGFRNITSFNNAFRLCTGCTPGEWCRRKKRGEGYEKVKTDL